jgi:hypothetical protein
LAARLCLPIIRLAAKPPRRWRPLSSNVGQRRRAIQLNHLRPSHHARSNARRLSAAPCAADGTSGAMLRIGSTPSHRASVGAGLEHIAPPECQSVAPAPSKRRLASSSPCRRRFEQQRAATSSDCASTNASIRAVPLPSSARFVTFALANPSLERGPPPAWRREALVVYDPPRGATPVASAQLKR